MIYSLFFTFINALLHRLFTNWGMNLWRKADYLFSFVFLQFCILSSLLITFSLCVSVRGVAESWRVLETAMCHLWTVWRRRTGSWGWKLLSCELAWRPTTRPGRTSTRERYYKIRTRMLRTGTCYENNKKITHLNTYCDNLKYYKQKVLGFGKNFMIFHNSMTLLNYAEVWNWPC